MMLSSLGSNALPGAQYFSSRRSVKNDAPNIHKRLPVHVLNGSTFASNPYTATAKLNSGYDPLPILSSGQPRSANYSPEHDTTNKLAAFRDVSKPSSFVASTSTVDPRAHERHPTSSSYGIHPSTSQDTYFYERSLSSRSDTYTNSDSSSADSHSIHESPSAVATNLPTANTTAAFQTLPLSLGASISSSSFHVQESSLHHVPALLPKPGTTASNNATPVVTRQPPSHPISAPLNKTTSSRVSTSSNSKSFGTDTATSDDASGAQERPTRLRVASIGKRTRDSRVLYPPTTTYLYASGRNSDEWEPVGAATPVRSGPEVTNSSRARHAPSDIGSRSVLSSGDAGRDIHDRLESHDVHLPYPPGLEQYAQNLQNISTGPTHSVPHRRHSDGEQVPKTSARPGVVEQGRPLSAPPTRCVRWNENLVCPSPILPSQRRKGWYNRRGDQLWTNDGAYKPPAQGQEYPPDLDDYPEFNVGWQNEEGVRIDMEHRLIPKQPQRSALKQTRNGRT